MGIESISIISKLLTQTQRAYVRPLLGIRSYKPIPRKTEELTGDVCNISKSLDIEEFFNGLISRGIGLFNNPKTKQAFIEKIQHNNMTLDELKKIMTEVDSKAFINLTNPTKTEIVFKQVKGVKLVRPLDFKEAEFVLKNNYTPQEMSEFVSIRERLINSRQIDIEDADVIIKNKMNERTMERFVSLRQQNNIEPDKALYMSYLKETEVQTISNKEISKFLELKDKKIRYQNSEEKILEYTLPPEEAAYCAKYDFNESQLQRFAKLKNEYFAKSSVRNSGVETKFEVEDILEWVKKDATDEDIFKYNYFLNNPQIFTLNRSEGEKILKINNNDFISSFFTINSRFTLQSDFKEKFISEFSSGIGIWQKLIDKLLNTNDYIKRFLQDIESISNINDFNQIFTNFISKFSKFNIEDKSLFNICKEILKDLKQNTDLSEKQLKFIDKLMAEKYKEGIENQGQILLSKMTMFFDYGAETPQAMARLEKLINLGLVSDAEYIASNKKLYDTIIRMTKDESLVLEDFNGNIQKLGVKDLAIISKFIDLTKFDLKPLLPNLSKWYKVCTGEKEEVGRVFESARNLLQRENRQITSNLVISDIEKISKLGTNPTDIYKDCLRLDENKNLIFSMGDKSFKVAVEKATIDGKSVVLIKNLEHEGQCFVGYDGGISKIDNLPQIDKENLQRSLFGFSRYSKKQDEIYADAIEHFPVKITDNKSECIIGKGQPALNIKPITSDMTDREFVTHYQNVLRTLKDTGNLSVKNILRIMPRFSIIQVNPYTTSKNGKMLYSISAEWKSADGVKWQLRTHSTDLGHYMNSRNSAENSDWIFRLGHEENGVAKFFEYNEAERKYTPTGDFLGRTSHIQIPHSPFSEEDNLLDNIHFQNIMRQISNNLAGSV